MLKGATQSFPGSTVAARCKAATQEYAEWCRANSIFPRVKAITEAWVSPPKGKPLMLSQSHAKAAALRHMVPWLISLCEARADESEEATLRLTLLRELHAMDQVWSSALPRRFLGSEEAARAAGHCEQALETLRVLQLPGRWRLVPKCHALTHIAYDSVLTNPRVVHCYQDEDFVGRAKRIWGNCHAAQAELRAVQRYTMHAAVRLNARAEAILGLRGQRGR